MTVKRIIALALSAIMLFAFSACSETDGDSTTEESSSVPTSETTEAESTQAESDGTDDEKILDIYIIAGQSNACGYTNITNRQALLSQAPELEKGFSNVHYSGNARSDIDYTTLVNNVKPWQKTTLGLGASSGKIGPEAGMADALSAYYNEDTGKHAGIIKYAHGGTCLLNEYGGSNQHGNWVSPTYAQTLGVKYEGATGGLYRGLLEQVEKSLSELDEYGFAGVSIKAMYWMQGESDRAKPAEYKKAFEYFVADLRTDLSLLLNEYTDSTDDCGALEMPVFVGTISETFSLSASDTEGTSNKAFIQMQKTLPSSIDACYIVDNSTYKMGEWKSGALTVLGSDPYHWNQADAFIIGKNVGDAMLSVGID